MNERYIPWWTPHMSRDFEIARFQRRTWPPLILFPTPFGRCECGCHRVAVCGARLDDRRWCGHHWNYWRDMLPYYLSTL